MSKKKLLRLMEGKHHDAKPKYSRKGRQRVPLSRDSERASSRHIPKVKFSDDDEFMGWPISEASEA